MSHLQRDVNIGEARLWLLYVCLTRQDTRRAGSLAAMERLQLMEGRMAIQAEQCG